MTKPIKELKRSKVIVNLLAVAAILVSILAATAALLAVVLVATAVSILLISVISPLIGLEVEINVVETIINASVIIIKGSVAIAKIVAVVGLVVAVIVGLIAGIMVVIRFFLDFVDYVFTKLEKFNKDLEDEKNENDIKELTNMSKKEITNKIKLENYTKKYIELKSNDDIYNGICPVCRKSSLNIYPKKQTFDCTNCHFTGDLFDFVKKIDSLTFKKALQKINAELKIIEKSTANPL